jgi:hypothetical protein
MALKTVIALCQTCESCPAQWEGRTDDGSRIYIRYRWGCLQLEVDGERVYRRQIGGAFDGALDEDEMKARLSAQLQFGPYRQKEKSMAYTTDFHVYPNEQSVQIVMDANDPQRGEIMDAVASVMDAHERTREAEECLKTGKLG